MSNKKSVKQTPAAAQKMKDFLNRIRQKIMPETITGAALPVPRAALNEALQEYARQQGISNFSVESGLNLQQQIRAYERGIENRRQMLLDMAQTNVSAVKGKNFAPQRRATDVSLPYEPQAVNWNKIAKGLSSDKTATGSNEAKAAGKRRRNRRKTAPVQRRKTATNTVSRTLAKVEEIWMSFVFDEDEDDEYLDDEEDVVVEPKTQPTPGMAASPPKPTPKSGEGSARSSSSRSSSSSSSSESSIRERGRWASIVVAIVAPHSISDFHKFAPLSNQLYTTFVASAAVSPASGSNQIMDIIRKEIERKRKQIEETNLVKDKKFFRRGDLEAYQREQYWKNYNEKHAKKLPAPSTSIIDQFRTTEENSNLPENDESLQPQLSPEEVIRKLRDRNAPIRLFGEGDLDAFKRLRTLEVDLPDVETGFRNDRQAAMDQVDENFLKEIIAGHDADKRHDAVVEDETITFNELRETMEKELGKGNHERDSDLIHQFFNFILQKWGRELNSRPMDEKRSSTGKFALVTYTQTREYLNPLFKKLKTKVRKSILMSILNVVIQQKTCLSDIREHLVNIALCLLKRDYIQANNCYMEMAIGNAPWPVGVTASGIHKRPGSEKLYVRNLAHVLNDELQRKYIQNYLLAEKWTDSDSRSQTVDKVIVEKIALDDFLFIKANARGFYRLIVHGIKRLMTRCQVYFVTDPSKCVEYRGIGND